MHPHLAHRLTDLRLRDLHAEAARDRLVARARPAPAAAPTLGFARLAPAARAAGAVRVLRSLAGTPPRKEVRPI